MPTNAKGFTMSNQMVDVTIHLSENTTHADREALRDAYLQHKGVTAADYHDAKPHLLIVVYDPEATNSSALLQVATKRGLHAQLVGL
jgi:4-hydroxy-3-methylbut-2-enyl diphosphate reductase IspH